MIAIGTFLRAKRVHHLLQGWHDSGGQWHLRDVKRHRHQAVVADGTDEIDDAALAEGVLDALERRVRDAARRQQFRDEVIDGLLVLGHARGALVSGDGIADGWAQSRFEGEPAVRVKLVLRGPLTAGHDDRHLVQWLGDGGPEPHEGAEALDEIAQLRASQKRIEGTAEAGAAWA